MVLGPSNYKCIATYQTLFLFRTQHFKGGLAYTRIIRLLIVNVQ